MSQHKLSLSYKDFERGIYKLSLEEQFKLTEIIFANLKAALSQECEKEKKIRTMIYANSAGNGRMTGGRKKLYHRFTQTVQKMSVLMSR